tara:strand:- start:2696 stop:3004 length:309 start_codon:yes stop_codon:yes gene_type:complete
MKTKRDLAEDINQQLSILNDGSNRRESFYNLHRLPHNEINIIRRFFDALIEYQTGVIRGDDINDDLLKSIVDVAKFAFINAPTFNRDIKKKCQKIIDVLGDN